MCNLGRGPCVTLIFHFTLVLFKDKKCIVACCANKYFGIAKQHTTICANLRYGKYLYLCYNIICLSEKLRVEQFLHDGFVNPFLPGRAKW